MRSKSYHHEDLAEHCEDAHRSPIISSVRVKLVVLKNASANMARVEKVSCCAVGHENAHDTGISPVIAFGDLKCCYLSSEGPQ
jgi:hypothetical protein